MHGVLAGELGGARVGRAAPEAFINKLREEHNYKQGEQSSRGGLTDANRRFHAAINSVAASPTISVILRNTLHYFPDLGIEVPGWRGGASRWRSELIDAFTKGDRERHGRHQSTTAVPPGSCSLLHSSSQRVLIGAAAVGGVDDLAHIRWDVIAGLVAYRGEVLRDRLHRQITVPRSQRSRRRKPWPSARRPPRTFTR